MSSRDDEAAVERVARALYEGYGWLTRYDEQRVALKVIWRDCARVAIAAYLAGPPPRAVRKAVLRQELAEQQAAHAQAEPGSPDWIATSARAAWLEDRIETLAELAREGESDG